MRKLLLTILLLILAGCASQRATTTHQVERDSVYYSRAHVDSLFKAIWQRDSVYRRDSIIIYQRGDTVTRYVEKEVYKWRNRTDTVYRDRLRVDTVYMERTDSVHVEKPVYIEKPIKWYNQGFIWVGRLCIIALILWVLFLYLKRKF